MPLQSIEAEVNFSLCLHLFHSCSLFLTGKASKAQKAESKKHFNWDLLRRAVGWLKGHGRGFKLGSRRSGGGWGTFFSCFAFYTTYRNFTPQLKRTEEGRERERKRIEQKLRLWLSFRLKFIVLMERMFYLSIALSFSLSLSLCLCPSPSAPWTESIPLICGAFACNFLNWKSLPCTILFTSCELCPNEFVSFRSVCSHFLCVFFGFSFSEILCTARIYFYRDLCATIDIEVNKLKAATKQKQKQLPELESEAEMEPSYAPFQLSSSAAKAFSISISISNSVSLLCPF